jgi:hypothetical protein
VVVQPLRVVRAELLRVQRRQPLARRFHMFRLLQVLVGQVGPDRVVRVVRQARKL